MDSIAGFIKDNPAAITGLLAGGGIGALGGALATGDEEDDGEGAKGRISRRLRNALIGAAAGGAAGGSLGYALGENGPIRSPLPEGDESPEMAAFSSIPGRGILGGIGAFAGSKFDAKKMNRLQKEFLGTLATGKNHDAPTSFKAVEDAANSGAKGIRELSRAYNRNTHNAGNLSFVNNAELAGMNISEDSLGKLNRSFKSTLDPVKRLKKFELLGLLNDVRADRKLMNRLARNRYTATGALIGGLSPEIASALGLLTGASSDFYAPVH